MDNAPGLTAQSPQPLGWHLLELCTTSGFGGVLIDTALVVAATNPILGSMSGVQAITPGQPLTGVLYQICAQVLATGAPVIDHWADISTDPMTGHGFQLTIMPLFDGIGPPSGAVLMVKPHADTVTTAQPPVEATSPARHLLAEREARLSLALTAAKANTFRYDLSSRCLHYEDELSRAFGLQPGAPVAFEDALEKLVLPEDRQHVRNVFAKLDAGEVETINVEWHIHHPTLGRRTCASIGEVVSEHDGRARSFIGITLDITVARKQQQEHQGLAEAASVKEAELELVLDTINAGMFRYDFDAKVTSASPSLRKLYALPADPALIAEEDWWDLIHIDDRARVEHEQKTAITASQQIFTSKFKIARASFGIRWISIRAHLAYDETGRAKSATGIALDVTDQTQREGFLSLALETLLGGHFDFNASTQAGEASPAVNDLIGVPQGPMVPNAQWQAAIHPDDRDFVNGRYQQAVQRQQSRLDRTYRILHPERGERWIDDRRLQLFSNDGAHVRSVGIMFDITAQKQRERELLALIKTAEAAQFDAQHQAATVAIRNKQLRIAFDAARIGPFEYDVAGGQFIVPLPPEEGITSALKTKTVAFEKILARVHPDDRALFEAAFNTARPNPSIPLSIEYRFFIDTDQIIWVLTRGQVLSDKIGSTGRLVGVSLDITEAKTRESDIIEARKRLHQAAEAARAAPFVYNLSDNTVIFDWAPSTNQPKDGAISLNAQNALTNMHPEDQARLRHATGQVLAGRRDSFSIDFAHPATPPDMPARWFSMHAQAQYDNDGRAQRIVGLLLDVTEKRQQEAAFKAQQELLATALEAAAVVVVSYDYVSEEITFDQVSEPFRPFLPAYPGTSPISSVLKHVHPADLPLIHSALNPDRRTGDQSVSLVIRSRPETPPLWLAVKGQIERDQTGNCKTFNGFLIDITRQRMAEVALIDASRLAMIGELATGVAHELRQPLNAIKLAAHNLQRRSERDEDVDKSAIAERLSLIARNVERADRVISALRNLSRKPNSEKFWFDVADTLRELILLQSDVIQEAGVELNVVLEDGVRIYGEPHRLEQAVLNLLSNAIHAATRTPADNKPALTLSLAPNRDRGYLDVVVTDNGPGIDPSVLGNIFTPFMTTKGPSEGMGLGLSIVHSIVVQEFGGTITAENTGSGARFRIRLRLPPAGAEPGAGSKPRS